MKTTDAIDDWYVLSQMQHFGPDQLHNIPANRRFLVAANVSLGSRELTFCWDSLEQSVLSKASDDDKTIAEVHCSKFWKVPTFQERIRSTVTAVVDETLGDLRKNETWSDD